MKKNKLKIILILSFFHFNKFQSQTTLIQSVQSLKDVASPEISNIMRYSDFPEMDYIGKTNISIPVYNINFGKLNIPIGLSYNTKGNKASDIATSVGLGWNLVAGGNLTLKVNDMNDFMENYSYYNLGGFEAEQTYAWHRQSKGYLSTDWPQALSDTQVSSSQLCFTNRIWWNDDSFIDSAPDFYYINAPGFNDKFYLTRVNDSQFKINFLNSTNSKLNNNLNLTIKTACAGFESDPFGSQGGATVYYQPDKFEIIGENGYIYTFNDTEGSLLMEYPVTVFSYNTFQVNNWYLTKIKDPYSGKEINFEYEYITNNYEHLSLLRLNNYIDFGGYNVSSNFELGTLSADKFGSLPLVTNRVISSKLGARRLRKIITDNEIVDFIYDVVRIDYAGNALTGIQIKNKVGNIIKQNNFTYSYFDSSNCLSGNYECKRLKLETMNDSSLGKYTFYYDNNVFPPRNTSKVDFLGYFNNNSSNITFSKTDYHPYDSNYYPMTKTYFYPDLAKDNIFPFQLRNKTAYKISDQIDRTPSTISQLGLLKKIIYPTGGFLEVEYENDDFMYEGEKYILGSTRVNSMRLYDFPNTLSKEIKYKYLNADNTSSGQINFIATPESITKSEISSGIGFNTDAIIGYSRIIEETIGKGYIEKKYTNFNDYPDKLMESDQNFTNQADKNFLKFMKFPHSYVQSFDGRRGKLLSVNYYKEGVIPPIKKEEYIYDYQVKNSLKVTKLFSAYTMTNKSEYTASNYLLTYFNNVKSNTKEDFFSTGNIKEENTFDYDGARLISKKNIIGADTTEEFYRNAKDKSIQKLINANILDIPIEVEKRKNGKLLSKQETKYEHPYTVLPSSIVSSNLENSSNIITEITYDQYDSKGNLLQYTTKDGISTTIIWGYNNTQPIAKIENAKLADINPSFINAIVSASDTDATAAPNNDETALLNAFKTFRDNLPGYKITTYSYDPLIGVRSITPPSGIKQIYLYDSANRLKEIRENNQTGNLLKEFKYNYKQ